MRYDFDLENRRESRKKLIQSVLITVLEAVAVVLLGFVITHYGMETFTMTGQYMEPTLKHGDRLLINKLSYRMHSIKRNDVVLVEQRGSEHNYYSVERIIGLPGEQVQIQEGKVYIDGKELKEKYDFPLMENGGLALETVTLDEDEYFVLCDNRNYGEDSRNANVGNILLENIVGKVWIRLNTVEFVNYLDEFAKEKARDEAKEEAE